MTVENRNLRAEGSPPVAANQDGGAQSQGAAPRSIADADFSLLTLHLAGEVPADRQAEVAALLADSPAARAGFADLELTRELVREFATEARLPAQAKWARQDLSLLGGQVMRKLPNDEQLRPVAAGESGLIAWIRGLGLGKVGTAVALAGAAAAWMIATSSPPVEVAPPATDGEIAAIPGTNLPARNIDPMVIIEEMEIDSGSIMVDPPREEGGATVIWHFDGHAPTAVPAAGGEG